MKKLFTGALLLCALFSGFAQSKATVEKSIWNVQAGPLGVFVNNEYGLGEKFALRSEIGLDAGFSTNGDDTKWGLLPAINIEPRYYYNIAKRAAKGRNTSGNASNFVTVLVKYSPDWFVISNKENVTSENLIGIVPKWGIRRNIGKTKLNYEAGIGLGYYNYIGSDRKYYNNPEGVALDLHLRIGYRF
jgi:hypothetical protein